MEHKDSVGAIYSRCTIKSFKHDGSLHRVWLENWRVPADKLHSDQAAEGAEVLLNEHTPVREADGKEWISRVPAVSFFLPGEWFNVVALLDDKGIRYYCNLASPPYLYQDVLTYVDYDLDVILLPDGSVHELDRDEYMRHKAEYRYDAALQNRIDESLRRLQVRMSLRQPPFTDEQVRRYYRDWKDSFHSKER